MVWELKIRHHQILLLVGDSLEARSPWCDVKSCLKTDDVKEMPGKQQHAIGAGGRPSGRFWLAPTTWQVPAG